MTEPAKRSLGGFVARVHRDHRGVVEIASVAFVGLLAGASIGGCDPAAFLAAAMGASVLVVLILGVASGIRSRVDDTAVVSFAQIEALMWLVSILGLSRPLRPTRGYAASPDFLLELVRLIDEKQPLRVLELGSGVSTVVLASRLAGRGEVVSLDHDPGFAAQTRDELVQHGLSARVVDAPLVDVSVGGQAWRWYQVPGGLGKFDMLVVDGPPGDTGRLARYPALPVLVGNLEPGAVVCIDDGIRDDEREMVKRWVQEQPGSESRYLETEKGMYVVTLPGQRLD